MNTKIHILPLILLLLMSSALFISCNQQSVGFALPSGDIASGKATFEKLSCNECHSVADIEWKENTENEHVPLGGKVATLKTYGELVTSIINPSHKIAKAFRQVDTSGNVISKMKNYNDVMTVQELVDIVTFLQTKYEIETPPTYYRPYG